MPPGSRRLLAYLALHPAGVDRRCAAGVLWPTVDDGRGGTATSTPMLVTVGGFDEAPVPGFSCELREGGQYLVRANEWQSAQPASDMPSLVACVVAPGFDFADFSLAEDPPKN